MKAGIALVTIATTCAFPILASPGMIGAAMHFCHAEKMNRLLVRTCSETHPDLAAQARRALDKWREHFGDRASKAAAACAELWGKASPERRGEFEVFTTKMFDGVDKRASEPNPAFCVESIAQIEARPNPLYEQLFREVK